MMYIKIENPINTPISSAFWTIWGASTKRDIKDDDKRIIGQFGSGGNHSIALCLRQGVSPIIYNENQKLEFFTQPICLESINGTQTQHQVGVNISGKDSKGMVIRKREILNHTLSFGSIDWNDEAFAMREFISNAIDACYLQGLDHTSVVIEIVEENKVRAKDGKIRVFLPLTTSIQNFYNNIGSWFLHFSNPELLSATIFPRRNMNINHMNGSMIYRRGVLVCEVNSRDEGIFDYNVDDIKMNESRSVDSWTAVDKAAATISASNDAGVLCKLISSFNNDKKFWEKTFPNYYFNYPSQTTRDTVKNAWQAINGDKAVICTAVTAKMCKERGYNPVVLPDNYNDLFRKSGIMFDEDVLSPIELKGKQITDPSEDFVKATKFVWDRLASYDLVKDRPFPEIKGFSNEQTNNTVLFGFWEKDTIAFNNMMDKGMNAMLLHTVIEELVHHITKAYDGSRDFQNFLITIIAKTLFKDFGNDSN